MLQLESAINAERAEVTGRHIAVCLAAWSFVIATVNSKREKANASQTLLLHIMCDKHQGVQLLMTQQLLI